MNSTIRDVILHNRKHHSALAGIMKQMYPAMRLPVKKQYYPQVKWDQETLEIVWS